MQLLEICPAVPLDQRGSLVLPPPTTNPRFDLFFAISAPTYPSVTPPRRYPRGGNLVRGIWYVRIAWCPSSDRTEMVCFPEMLFLLSALAPYALSTADQACATAMGRDAPIPADSIHRSRAQSR